MLLCATLEVIINVGGSCLTACRWRESGLCAMVVLVEDESGSIGKDGGVGDE